MGRLTRIVVACSLCAAVVVATAAQANAAPGRADGLVCGQTLKTSVVFSEDMTCPGNGGLHLQPAIGERITVDLGGHTLTMLPQPDPGHCNYVALGPCAFDGYNARVTNGRVVGGHFFGTFDVDHMTIEDGSIDLLNRSRPASVRRNVIVRGRVGIEGAHVRVEGNLFVQGGVYVNDLDHGTTDLSIRNNHFLGSSPPTDGGVSVAIEIRAAAYFGPGDISGVIAENVVAGFAYGIYMHGALQTVGAVEITDNVVRVSGGDGIHVEGRVDPSGGTTVGGPVTLTRNMVMDSGGMAINAPWIPDRPTGVVDGGRNRALRSGVSPPCLGVVCRSGGRAVPV